MTTMLALGRHYGSTLMAATAIAHYATFHSDARIAIVAHSPTTFETIIKPAIEALPEHIRPSRYSYALGRFEWGNGAVAPLYAAVQGADRLRGPQWHVAWAHAPLSWPEQDHIYDTLLFGLRLGREPWVAITEADDHAT